MLCCKRFLQTIINRNHSIQFISTTNPSMDLSNYDDVQVKLMGQHCIAVDENDKVVGPRSKLECHQQSEGLPLHRAFSLFLFNSNKELLMQRRSSAKITFPGHFTNTCCSHPLHNDVELSESGAIGVKLSAQRRLQEELGVDRSQLPLESITYLTRIHYKATSGEEWGEHEIDYVLFAKCDVDLNINLNEVSEVQYVSLEKFNDFRSDCEKQGIPLTPWFKLIAKSHLLTWWKNLDNLDQYTNHDILKL